MLVTYVGEFSNNCHHHVARVLNIMRFEGKENWNQVDVWWMCLVRSRYLSWYGLVQVYLPFLIMVGLIITLSVLVK